jgi:hypothetical protein
MAADKIHFKFFVGTKAVCVENGSGHADPYLHDSVTISIRATNEKGKVGARDAVKFSVKRSEIAAIGLSFLDVAHLMTPETMWARSQRIWSSQAQQRPVALLTEKNAEQYEQYRLRVPELLAREAHTIEKLHSRMHILQRAQFLLESVDDNTAAQLDMVLTLMEKFGPLPIEIGIVNDEGTLVPRRSD